MNRLVYLIGEPGVGKSTLMEALTEGLVDVEVSPAPVPHTMFYGPYRDQHEPWAIEIGRRRADFSGTDALSMSIAPKAREWIATVPHPLVLAEGDRLASPSFWLAAEEGGYRVDVVLLDADPEVAAARRAERGSDQGGSWLKGRLTKVRNLRPHATIVLNAALETEALVRGLRREIPELVVDSLPG